MTQARDLHPVLLVGGSGIVGRVAARTLRRFQPELPLLIVGRDLPKAEALAREVGRAQAVSVDLTRADLAVADAVSAVVTLLKDDTLNALKFAQQRGVPLIAFSDWSFDIAPEVAQFAHRPAAAPVLLLGHVLGGTVIASTLHFARGDTLLMPSTAWFGPLEHTLQRNPPEVYGLPDWLRAHPGQPPRASAICLTMT